MAVLPFDVSNVSRLIRFVKQKVEKSLAFHNLKVSSAMYIWNHFVSRVRRHFPLDCVFTSAGIDVDDGCSYCVSLEHPVIFDVLAVCAEGY